jgi:hypothetical protein
MGVRAPLTIAISVLVLIFRNYLSVRLGTMVQTFNLISGFGARAIARSRSKDSCRKVALSQRLNFAPLKTKAALGGFCC